MKTHFFSIFALLFALASCASLPKLVENKKYEKAVETGVRRFQQSSKRRPEDVKALETAFNAATQKDLDMVKYLKEERREENWLRITEVYKKMGARQQQVQSISPLLDENGYKANFNFINVDAEMNESKAKSAELYYNKGAKLLTEAQTNSDRFKAREAYNEFVNMEQYETNFKDGQQLKTNAKELGMTTVLLNIVNNTGRNLNPLWDSLFSAPPFQNEGWLRYQRQNSTQPVHYTVQLLLQKIEITPNTNDSREFRETAMVQDGVTYQRDTAGQLVLNSQGDPISIPQMVAVSCNVRETRHHKTATLTALVEIREQKENKMLVQQTLLGTALYEHFTAGLLSGDPRAISPATQVRIKNRQAEFPTDDALAPLALPQLYRPLRDFYIYQKKLIK